MDYKYTKNPSKNKKVNNTGCLKTTKTKDDSSTDEASFGPLYEKFEQPGDNFWAGFITGGVVAIIIVILLKSI